MFSQQLNNVPIDLRPGLSISKIVLIDSSTVTLPAARPLFSFTLNEKIFNSDEVEAAASDTGFTQVFENRVSVTTGSMITRRQGWKEKLIFENTGQDTLSISNVVPFGQGTTSVYYRKWPMGSCPGIALPSWFQAGQGYSSG